MKENFWSGDFRIIKLPIYYLLYQFLFSVIAMVAVVVYCFSSGILTLDMSNERESLLSAIPQELLVWATALPLFCSAAVMLWQLLFFGYFKFGKAPFSEVKKGVMFLSIMLVFAFMFFFNIAAQELELPDVLAETMKQLSNNVIGCFSIAVLGPILEEVLFRGAIQGYLMRRYNNPWVGIIVSAAIFGVIHLNPIQVFYAFFLGIAFGWIYYRTRSIMPVLIGHVLNNSFAAISMLISGSETEQELLLSDKIMLLAGSAVVAVVLVYLINRMLPAVPRPWRGADENPVAEA